MKNLALSFLFFAVSLCSTAQDTGQQLDELVSAYAGQSKFNGTVLVARQGKILLEKGYGLKNVTDSSRHTPGSIFQIGSVTKQMTAVLILKLQELKKLSVTDKLSKYFPAYPKGDSISIEQLLTHTSGIYSYTSDRSFMESGATSYQDQNAMMSLFQDKPLSFSPGTGWEYSNSGYSLLGYIIEKASGMTYYEAVRKYLFLPAGMTESGFDFTRLKDPNKSSGYYTISDRGYKPAPIVDSSVSYAAGAVYATTRDLYRWNQALWSNKLIRKESREKGWIPVKNQYGYGIFIDSFVGKRKLEHSGSIFGFNSNMVTIPEDQICIILLANAGTPFMNTITKSLLAILYNQPYSITVDPTGFQVSEEKLAEYAAVYEAKEGMVIKLWVEKGKLIGQPEGQQALELRPEKEDLFYVREVDARVRFDRNDKKEITDMVLIQNGREIKAPRRK